MNYLAIPSILLLLVSGAFGSHHHWRQIAQRYEEPVEQVVYPAASQAYRFGYTTGGLHGVSDVAQHFREESRDESGYVTGKYGYVDPYGKLMVVNYRAGPEGYTASGDIGADEEGLRQQRELYSTDRSYQIQQQVWQALAAGQPIEGILASAAGASAAASASASASSSSSSSSNGAAHQSEWTSVSGGHEHTADYTNVKGGNRFVERYTAAGGVKSPAAQIRETSTTSVNSIKSSSTSASSSAASSSASSSAYTAPAVTKTITTSTKTAPLVVQTARYVQPTVTQTVYHTKTAPVQTAAIKQYSYQHTYQSPAQTYQQVVQPARLVQTTKTVSQPAYYTSSNYYQSPAARLTSINSASSSSASAAASASASSSSSASSGAYTAGVKGYSGAIKSAPLLVAPVKVARYAVVPSGGRTVVNFQQGGPVPYRYSYAFK